MITIVTGLATKDATSTSTVKYKSSLILTNYERCSLRYFNVVCRFSLFLMDTGPYKKTKSSILLDWRNFIGVVEVASFVGNPVT